VARQHPAHGNLSWSYVILRGLVLSGEVMKEIASSSKTKSKIELKKKHAFDAHQNNLLTADHRRTLLSMI
jgi:hypothetical protein